MRSASTAPLRKPCRAVERLTRYHTQRLAALRGDPHAPRHDAAPPIYAGYGITSPATSVCTTGDFLLYALSTERSLHQRRTACNEVLGEAWACWLASWCSLSSRRRTRRTR